MQHKVLALCLLAVAGARATAQQPAVVVSHVTVIDVERGTRVSDQTVVVQGVRIRRVGPASSVEIPAGAIRVDGRGKFLIPGLWDMHVHLFTNNRTSGPDSHAASFPLFIANGVTGVRDMWTDEADRKTLEAWRNEAAAGRLAMPLVVPTSTPIDGLNTPGRPNSLKVPSPERARRLVDSLVAGGARIIKILNPSRDVYFATLEETKKQGASMVGHVTAGVHAIEASEGGQRSIEHLQSVIEGCSSAEAMLDSAAAVARNQILRQQTLIATFDEAKCNAMFDAFKRNHTWQTPTSALRHFELGADDPSVMSDPHFRYATTDTVTWRAYHVRAANVDTALIRSRRSFDEFRMQFIARMYRAGVPMLIGTDLGNPFIVAGFGVHDEMVITVKGGATPAQVLRAATLEPALYLGATDSLGTIAAGKRADMVLLDADPLDDIANAAKIRSVILGGRVFDRKALDALLETAARVAPNVWKQ